MRITWEDKYILTGILFLLILLGITLHGTYRCQYLGWDGMVLTNRGVLCYNQIYEKEYYSKLKSLEQIYEKCFIK